MSLDYETFAHLKSDLHYRIDRMRHYQDDLSRIDLIAWLEEIYSDLGDYDDIHSECVSEEREYELMVQVDELEAKLQAKTDRSKLNRRIKELEQEVSETQNELSDLRADAQALKNRLAKEPTRKRFTTPEQARAHFICLSGGVA